MNNNIKFQMQDNTQRPWNLSSKTYPEFSFYDENEQDHLSENFFITSNLIDNKDTNDIIFSKVKTLCHFFLGASYICDPSRINNMPFWVNIYRDNQRIAPLTFDEIPFYEQFKIPNYTNDEYSKFTPIAIFQYIALAIRDDIFSRVLLFASDRYGYIEMYKILDTVKQTSKESFLDNYKVELDKFGYTANNFSASGFASRHGKNYGAPSANKYLSINDSRDLFAKIIEHFYDERKNHI